MAKRLSVVISQSPSKNPGKRNLEEDIVAGLIMENGIDVTIVPNLYDIKPDSTGMLALQQIKGHMVVISWLFERAAHWTLDRHGINGRVGQILLVNEDEDEEDDDDDFEEEQDDSGKPRVIETRNLPKRKIYCLDLKVTNRARDFIAEVKRIQKENEVKVVGLGDLLGASPSPAPKLNGNQSNGEGTNGAQSNGVVQLNGVKPETQQRMQSPTNDTAISANGDGLEPSVVNRIESTGGRRWYPVIDYSRCTNCMECIDFCLFGVYGVDTIDTILVEQPDNCRRGCPACSRVCPENAIMFPQHKSPAIAGSAEETAGLKIDLSQLFGAPKKGKSAAELAAMERDEQLLAAGRDAVGANGTSNSSKPKVEKPASCGPKDELDDLVDALNDLDI
ncbi:MAG: ferredoxin family protein [Planctomycetota bacterium]